MLPATTVPLADPIPPPAAVPGGYLRVQVVPQLLLPLWLFTQKRLSFLALRLYLAALELAKQHGFAPLSRRAQERRLAFLTGARIAEVRQGLRHLEAEGLLQATAAGYTLTNRLWPRHPQAPRLAYPAWCAHLEAFQGWCAAVGPCPPMLPVPRRALRAVVRATVNKPALLKVTLGVWLRCCRLRGKRPLGTGRVSIDWLHNTLCVSRSQVSICLDRGSRHGWWTRHAGGGDERPHGRRTVVLFAPYPGGPSQAIGDQTQQIGDHAQPIGDHNPAQADGARTSADSHQGGQPPAMDNHHRLGGVTPPITLQDLGNVQRLYEVYTSLVQQRKMPGGTSYWHAFLALACSVRRQSASNPGGLLVHLVTRGAWERITQADEDAAGPLRKAWQEGIHRRA